MTHFIRRALVLVIAISGLLPIVATSATAQGTTLDGSQCWQPGQLSISGASMTWDAPPATIIDPAGTYTATLQTSAGTIEVELDAANAPIATNNFICLALAGYYTGTDFHRIAADSFVQGGDPTGSGTGGPGYTVPSDPTVGSYPVGSIALANMVPNENGSQFFIAVSDLTGLIPSQYPVFGQVTSGMDVVQTISKGAVQANASGEQSQPVDPSVLLDVTISESAAASTTPSGPPLPVATAIPATIAPTVASVSTPSPTPEATTSDAQSRPGSTFLRPSPTPPGSAAGGSDCTGLDEYETAFDEAYTNAAIANPDALAFLMELQQSEDSQNMFANMTPEQATAMSAFYLALADEIEKITPPPFAAEWQQVQVEIFRVLGDFSANIASQGVTIASIQASPKFDELTARSNEALAAASAICGDFRAWANGDTQEGS